MMLGIYQEKHGELVAIDCRDEGQRDGACVQEQLAGDGDGQHE